MSQFQKIAVGLLGLTNPEMFIPIAKPSEKPTAKIESACDQNSAEVARSRGGEGTRVVRAFRYMMAALAIAPRAAVRRTTGVIDLRDRAN